jgi:hypothetical protein
MECSILDCVLNKSYDRAEWMACSSAKPWRREKCGCSLELKFQSFDTPRFFPFCAASLVIHTGDRLTFRAVVTRVWASSIEVYVCSHADVRRAYPPPPEGIQPCPGPASRFTNEAFLTLVALTPTLGPGPYTVASPAHGNWTRLQHDGHLTPVHEDGSPALSVEGMRRRQSTMLPTSATPVKIGAAIIEPAAEGTLVDIVRGADKRRAERLDMREMLLR